MLSVFDVTREDSLAAAKTWIETIREWSDVKNMPGVIIGNKTDLTERRSVPAKAGLDTANSLKVQYLECSAKDNVGVEDPFFYLANEFHKLHADQASTMAHIAWAVKQGKQKWFCLIKKRTRPDFIQRFFPIYKRSTMISLIAFFFL